MSNNQENSNYKAAIKTSWGKDVSQKPIPSKDITRHKGRNEITKTIQDANLDKLFVDVAKAINAFNIPVMINGIQRNDWIEVSTLDWGFRIDEERNDMDMYPEYRDTYKSLYNECLHLSWDLPPTPSPTSAGVVRHHFDISVVVFENDDITIIGESVNIIPRSIWQNNPSYLESAAEIALAQPKITEWIDNTDIRHYESNSSAEYFDGR